MQLLTIPAQGTTVVKPSPAFPNVSTRKTPVEVRGAAPWSIRPRPGCHALPEPEPRDVVSRFGRRLRALRHASGMTQMQVAVQFGIDRTFISDVERGRKGVGLPTLEIFALGFGVSLSDLLRGL